jgi:glycosyltransferase involved in cell wall biosynthesis
MAGVVSLLSEMDATVGRALEPSVTPVDSTRTVRVLHVINGLHVGGAESALVNLVTCRVPGIEHEIATLVPGGFHTPGLRSKGIPVTELGMTGPGRAPFDLARLANLITRARPDVVQGWMYYGNVAALLALRLSSRRDRTALVWGIRCADADLVDRRLSFRAIVHASAYLSRFAPTLVANSNAGLEYHARRQFQSPRQLVIHNGIDIDRFTPNRELHTQVRRALGLEPSEVVVAHVARVAPGKGHRMLLESLRGLEGTGLRAVAIGAGTENLPEMPNLLRLGRRADVPAVLAASDVIASTSESEGFPNVLAEGMAAGLVPVATDTGDSRLIVGDTGSVVPIGDATVFRDALMSLARLPRQELERHGGLARHRIQKHFSLDVFVRRFAGLYRDLSSTTEG